MVVVLTKKEQECCKDNPEWIQEVDKIRTKLMDISDFEDELE